MAGGIIEYLAEGAWTKRLHAGWAAQSGSAGALGAGGVHGPRTVFEGVTGCSMARAHHGGRLRRATGDFGTRWVRTAGLQALSMRDHGAPYIDCARPGIKPEDVAEIVCEVAEDGAPVWSRDKQRPRNGYAAKFAVPYLLATGFVHGGVGLGAFTERDPR